MLNIGETHYPYALPGDDPEEFPRISGLHGVIKHMDDAPEFFDDDTMEVLRARQVFMKLLPASCGASLRPARSGRWQLAQLA